MVLVLLVLLRFVLSSSIFRFLLRWLIVCLCSSGSWMFIIDASNGMQLMFPPCFLFICLFVIFYLSKQAIILHYRFRFSGPDLFGLENLSYNPFWRGCVWLICVRMSGCLVSFSWLPIPSVCCTWLERISFFLPRFIDFSLFFWLFVGFHLEIFISREIPLINCIHAKNSPNFSSRHNSQHCHTYTNLTG